MYLRFVVNKIDDESSRRAGLFHALDEAAEKNLTHTDDKLLKQHYQWFKKNLKVPTSFSKAKRSNPTHKALSWFKPNAKDHISKIYEMKSILEENGYFVEVLKSKRPGYIVYEDEFQICAEPFSDTTT